MTTLVLTIGIMKAAVALPHGGLSAAAHGPHTAAQMSFTRAFLRTVRSSAYFS
jgi:hypothetical protein